MGVSTMTDPKVVLLLVSTLCVGMSMGAGVHDGMSADVSGCHEKCAETYSKEASQMKSCETGCRLLSIIESIDHIPGKPRSEQETHETMEETVKSCHRSCDSSFKVALESTSCKSGCENQVPTIEARRDQVVSPLASFFGSSSPGIIRTSFPRFMIRIPLNGGPIQTSQSMNPFSGFPGSLFGGSGEPMMSPRVLRISSTSLGGAPPLELDPSVAPSGSPPHDAHAPNHGISGMFEHMHKQMSEMMNSMMGSLPDMSKLMSSSPHGESHGRMVIMRSGPGYHEEKTYNINPDGSKTEIKSESSSTSEITSGNLVKSTSEKTSHEEFEENPEIRTIEDVIRKDIQEDMRMQNDMMNKMNPLDKGVEDFEPVEIRREPHGDESSNSVHGFDFSDFLDEKPRMSEGLRPRNLDTRPHYGYKSRLEMVCSETNPDKLKWSDWVSCLHHQMGLPRWLTAATISLGIVFVIWLCLVIPQNAPKQKMKMTKAMEAAQSLATSHHSNKMAMCMDANNPNFPPSYGKMDLPPAYDDIANLHVAVPIENVTVATAAVPTTADKQTAANEQPKI